MSEDSKVLAKVTVSRARRFLGGLVNLSGRDKTVPSMSLELFRRRFGDVLPQVSEMVPMVEEWVGASFADGRSESRAVVVKDGAWPHIDPWILNRIEELTGRPVQFTWLNKPSDVDTVNWWLGWMRALLRGIWDTPDARRREFLAVLIHATCLRLRRNPLWLVSPGLATVNAVPGPFEQVLMHMFRSTDLMRRCGNDDCPAPYFFAMRRSQKYCSEKCSGPSKREAKKRWWAEHGEDWRRKRTSRNTIHSTKALTGGGEVSN